MTDLREYVSDCSARESAALEAALRPGEAVRWAVRPLAKRGRRVLYLLTNHRALVLESGLFFCKVQAYPLHENMVAYRLCRPGGAGDLVFALPEGRGSNFDAGFTYLPDLLAAHRELNAAVAGLLEAAERHTGTAEYAYL